MNFDFLGEQISLAVVVSNSGLFRAKNKHQVPCKKQKAIRSTKKDVIYDLMTDLGLTPLLMIVVDKKYEADVICREIKSVKAE